jgi:Fe2+ or Zn2+ uptake regulation protein
MGRGRRRSPSEPVGVDEEWRLGVERALARDGYRFTTPRRAILDWIARRDTAFTPEALTEALGAQPEPSSRATVYRLLNWLQAAGWLARVHTSTPGAPGDLGAGWQHAYARALPGHYSAICRGCGAVLVVRGEDIATLVTPALAGTGFEVREHHLELYGLCGRCGTSGGSPAQGGGR